VICKAKISVDCMSIYHFSEEPGPFTGKTVTSPTSSRMGSGFPGDPNGRQNRERPARGLLSSRHGRGCAGGSVGKPAERATRLIMGSDGIRPEQDGKERPPGNAGGQSGRPHSHEERPHAWWIGRSPAAPSRFTVPSGKDGKTAPPIGPRHPPQRLLTPFSHSHTIGRANTHRKTSPPPQFYPVGGIRDIRGEVRPRHPYLGGGRPGGGQPNPPGSLRDRTEGTRSRWRTPCTSTPPQ
jgi:hypothetical protein